MMSNALISSILTVERRGRQVPPKDYGVEEFDFWTPQRRPQYKNIALKFHEKVASFSPENLKNTVFRPSVTANCWIAEMNDNQPWLELKWPNIQNISTIRLFFDVDYDHPMESAHREQPESIMPYCIRKFRIKDQDGSLLCDVNNNYQAIYNLTFDKARNISGLRIEFEKPADNVPVALFGLVCL
jgi:hypothetical protein